MVSKGKRSENAFNEVRKKKKLVLLTQTMIESGKVYKEPIYENSEIEIAFLWISPKGGVKEHTHLTDSESYYDVDNGIIEMCDIGQSHSCYNDEQEKWLLILTVKRK